MPNHIKPEELRIGNYHKSDDFNIPRMGISSDKINGQSYAAITGHGISLVEQGELKIEPIPLTTKWLERFWFESEKSGLESFYGMPNEDGDWIFELYPHLEGYNTVLTDVHIKYVHQLQNLFYALTGNELELKDKQ